MKLQSVEVCSFRPRCLNAGYFYSELEYLGPRKPQLLLPGVKRTRPGLTEHDGDDGEEGAAQRVHHPEGGALHQRRVEGQEGVAAPDQEGEDHAGGRQRQGRLQFVTAHVLTQV